MRERDVDEYDEAVVTYRRNVYDAAATRLRRLGWLDPQAASELRVEVSGLTSLKHALRADRDKARAERDDARKALAGHLFDGESVGVREAIRSELVAQGLAGADVVEKARALRVVWAATEEDDAWEDEPFATAAASAFVAAVDAYNMPQSLTGEFVRYQNSGQAINTDAEAGTPRLNVKWESFTNTTSSTDDELETGDE